MRAIICAISLLAVLGLLLSSNAQENCFSYTNESSGCPNPDSLKPSCGSTGCTTKDHNFDGVIDEITCSREGDVGVDNWASGEDLEIEFADVELDLKTGRWGEEVDFVLCYESTECGGCAETPTGSHVCADATSTGKIEAIWDIDLEGECGDYTSGDGGMGVFPVALDEDDNFDDEYGNFDDEYEDDFEDEGVNMEDDSV